MRSSTPRQVLLRDVKDKDLERRSPRYKGHRFSKVSYVSASARVWRLSMERRAISFATSVGLIIQALWMLEYTMLTLLSAIQSTLAISRLLSQLTLLVCVPCTVIPLWMARAVWTRRQSNFLLGLWTTWALFFGIVTSLSYLINGLYGHAISPVSLFKSMVIALMLVLPAYISAIYIATAPPVPEDQWW